MKGLLGRSRRSRVRWRPLDGKETTGLVGEKNTRGARGPRASRGPSRTAWPYQNLHDLFVAKNNTKLLFHGFGGKKRNTLCWAAVPVPAGAYSLAPTAGPWRGFLTPLPSRAPLYGQGRLPRGLSSLCACGCTLAPHWTAGVQNSLISRPRISKSHVVPRGPWPPHPLSASMSWTTYILSRDWYDAASVPGSGSLHSAPSPRASPLRSVLRDFIPS